ncbi:MAG TPA: DUF6580 family putative transport protein [Gammaproteobacteria bacterium]
MMNPRFYSLVAIVLVVSLYRIVPHPPNFTPVLAMALFAGVHFNDRRLAVIVPLVAMLIADLFLGLHATLPFVYAALLLLVMAGDWLRQRKTVTNVAAVAVGASVVFFLLTNFGVWLTLPAVYPQTFEGLLAAYVAAIPFYQNTLLSTLLFTGILFGGFQLLEHRYPRLIEERP